MLDEFKLKWMKRLGYGLLLCLVALIGFGIGDSIHQSKPSETKQTTSSKIKDKPLTQARVRDFLIAYYTKKDLGENRKRYKAYMTDTLYQTTIADEDMSINQTYKGFLVDFELEDAVIAIDEANQTAIAQVTYTNSELLEKDVKKGATTDIKHELDLRLNYTKDNNQWLVSSIERINISDSDLKGTFDLTSSTEMLESSEDSSEVSVTEASNTSTPT
ncbi:hypothetical protein [Streptococcus sp. zg-JUN1979]|uniref:hypothetical protein n=1 Tax=Streptococcus sp. zg-JUN1979 TaxID=3391450 RepID=UPI0039A4D879